jgi:hypothetical protein
LEVVEWVEHVLIGQQEEPQEVEVPQAQVAVEQLKTLHQILETVALVDLWVVAEVL